MVWENPEIPKKLAPIVFFKLNHQNEKIYTIYIIALEQTMHCISYRPIGPSAGAE